RRSGSNCRYRTVTGNSPPVHTAGPSPESRAPAPLRDGDVPDLVGPAPLARGEVGLLHRDDDRPMVADRAALDPPPPEPDRLDRDSGDPDGGEEGAAAAADDGLPADPISEDAGDDRPDDVEHDDCRQHLAAGTAHGRSMPVGGRVGES